MQWDFKVGHAKFRRVICIKMKIDLTDLVGMKCSELTIIYNNYMCHMCAKGFLDANFNQAILDKMSIFRKIAPNFTYT